ncbi:MAG: protoporphyrinogen oxidase [Candidatus Omnitrophica bacterium]|nr:protoporphyrinogen oxidase [Candidatus Omnitrophota bacterium]
MSKTIIIVGAGISGLATLHYLKKKYAARPGVAILLFEQSAVPGGTIHSVTRGNYLFETGPNGFLDSSPLRPIGSLREGPNGQREPNGKPRTLEFVAELGLVGELVKAGRDAQIRYLCLNNVLYPFPMSPGGFFGFRPMRLREKLRVFAEPFVARGMDPDESVYDFGARRFGKRFADIFLDPMVSGIYGGDARATVLKAAFARIHELEQRYGSLFKAMMKLRKGGMPKGTLTSFHRGQARLTDALARRYAPDVRFDQEVKSITRVSGRFVVATAGARYETDEVFVCAPAYQAATMIKEMSPSIARELEKIRYSPMAVIGLGFSRKAFERPPAGFGYLIPSSEGKEVLGVLFESNIFPGRCGKEEILLRIMVGGARYPDILTKPREVLIALALKEVQTTLKTEASPGETFFVQWPKAIPQYDRSYVEAESALEEKLREWKGLYLAANYRKGVSLNDCIENAYSAAQCSFL